VRDAGYTVVAKMHLPAAGASQQMHVPCIQRGNALADSTTPRSSRPSVRRASPALGCSITSGARSTAASCACARALPGQA